MRPNAWFLGAMAATALGLTACSSGGSAPAGGDAGTSASCVASAGGATPTAACTSCLEGYCAQELSDVQAGCASYLACICPEGTYRQNLVSGCATAGEDSTCVSPAQTLNACQSTRCADSCTSGGSDGGASG